MFTNCEHDFSPAIWIDLILLQLWDWKAQWDLQDSASLHDASREAPYVQISLLVLNPPQQAKRDLWQLQSNSVPEPKCWLQKGERNRSYSLISTCTAMTTSAEQAQGRAPGIDATHTPYPTCSADKSLRLSCFTNVLEQQWGEKHWAWERGGFKDISRQVSKALFLAMPPWMSVKPTLNSQS